MQIDEIARSARDDDEADFGAGAETRVSSLKAALAVLSLSLICWAPIAAVVAFW